ncbi:MAG: conjugal transfer protein TraG N-terminal domain-containing protein [Nitrospirota bacterium]
MVRKTCARFVSVSAFLFLFLVLFVSRSYALDMEYYTYGGHDAVVNSFQKLALIFSDSGYRGLFFTVIVLGILFGGSAIFLKVLAGVRISPIAWAWPVLIGVVLYLGLIIPRGTLHIYDPVLNRYQAVGDIPDGIVALAGILNKIEQGLVDIVSTSGTVGYKDSAGGIGVQVLLGSVNNTLSFPDRYIDQSVRGYVKDCMFFELTRPGTGLSLNGIKSNNTDFLPLFQQAASPAIYTVWYDDTRRDGESVTCQEACNRINTYMTQPSNFDSMTNVVCASAGFNPSDANELNKCKTIIQDYVQYLDGVSVPPGNYIRQVYIAQRIEDAARTGDTSTVGNFYIGVSSKGIGLMANEWLPIMRAVVTAIAIGMIPFLVIFIPTPLVGKAIAIISGFFIWLTAWGVTDAVVHQFAIDQGYKVFEQVRQNRLGYDALIFMNDASVKTLSMFGIIRTSGIMLATVLTGMLIRFGGHALSMLAGNLAGTIQSQGTLAAMKTEDPAGSAGLVSQMREAGPTHAWANQFSYWQTLRSGVLDKMSHTESNLQATDALGGIVKDAAHARGTGSALSAATGAYAAKPTSCIKIVEKQ